MRKYAYTIKVTLLGLFLGMTSVVQADSSWTIRHLVCEQNIVSLDVTEDYLLLPIQDDAPEGKICIVKDNEQKGTLMNVRLARERVDSYVPFALSAYKGQHISIEIQGVPETALCWKELKLSGSFDMANKESFRPVYHHTPAYGWMNDPNGMFYKDGVYHLYFQYNPYGSVWGNMHWGHSTSTDLMHWKFEGCAIVPDTWGAIFSGSCVVDHENTAGFGKEAVVAFYTSAKSTPWGDIQMQSMAYSLDNGKTFTKYEGNPILTSSERDFRDPKVFWYAPGKHWVMILAVGQHMEIYSSDNLKDWKYESSFGEKYGNHGGVWECPDLMKLKVRGTDKEKWMLICNINPGGPSGGSATQYFVGDFDGYKFTCESKPEVTKWMDYGKDHYATVTFDNAPEGRRVAIAWMSNWQYANQVPTQQYRSGNSIPRDLGLFEYKGETYCSVVPSPEMTAARSKKAGKKLTESCEMVVNLKGNATITLSNDKGEKVVMNYDAKAETFSMDRTKSGKVDFSKDFAAVTKAPTYGKISQLRIFIDKSSIEALDADGKMSMTNLVFPSKPYNKVTVKGKGKYQVYDIK